MTAITNLGIAVGLRDWNKAGIGEIVPNGDAATQQLAPADFAAKIRAKYPGSYDDIKDDVLTNRILTKYPQYRDMVKTPTQEDQAPNAQAQAQARFQPGGAGAGAVQYTPDRRFEMSAAKGFGLDPNQLALAEAQGGAGAGWKNAGSQILSSVGQGVATAAMDPLKAVTQPIDAMASNITTAAGLPDTGSIFSAKGYTKPDPGRLMGALALPEGLQRVGEGASKVAGATVKAVGAGVDAAMPSAARAGAALNEIKSVAGDHTIDVGEAGNSALRARELSQSGGRMPKVLNDFIKRATDPGKGPVTYAEGQDFYTNATKLSSEEFQQLSGPMKMQVADFTRKLGASLNEVAARAEKSRQLAMDEYSSAMRLKSAGEMAKKIAVRVGLGAAGATGAAGAYDIYRKMTGKR
jgi:hypothetical protein